MANLSEKELSMLEDQLSAENLLVKKYKAAAQNCQDQNLQTKFNQIASRHQDHFNRLMTYLN